MRRRSFRLRTHYGAKNAHARIPRLSSDWLAEALSNHLGVWELAKRRAFLLKHVHLALAHNGLLAVIILRLECAGIIRAHARMSASNCQ